MLTEWCPDIWDSQPSAHGLPTFCHLLQRKQLNMVPAVTMSLQHREHRFLTVFDGIRGFPKDTWHVGPLVDIEGSKWGIEVRHSEISGIECSLKYHGNDTVKADVCVDTVEGENLKYSGLTVYGDVLESKKKTPWLQEFSVDKSTKVFSTWADLNQMNSTQEGDDSVENLLEDDFILPPTYLPDNRLTVEATITIYGSFELSHGAHDALTTASTKSGSGDSLLNLIIRQVYCDETSDCRIVCTADGTTFPVHKFILSLRSDVFKAMLNTEMSETQFNTIEISEFSSDVVRGLVNYLYTDSFSANLLCSDDTQLFMIAHKYQLPGMVVVVEKHLIDTVDISTAVDRLLFASTYESADLRRRCVEFIAENVKEVARSAEFLDKLGFDLCKEILQAL